MFVIMQWERNFERERKLKSSDFLSGCDLPIGVEWKSYEPPLLLCLSTNIYDVDAAIFHLSRITERKPIKGGYFERYRPLGEYRTPEELQCALSELGAEPPTGYVKAWRKIKAEATVSKELKFLRETFAV